MKNNNNAPINIAQLRQQGFTHVVVQRRVLGDMFSPLAIFERLIDDSHSFLFESVEGGERWGRFSIIGLPATEWICAKNGVVRHFRERQCIAEEKCNPLEWLAKFHSARKVANMPSQLPFAGGLVGYFGYDIVAYIEPRVANLPPLDPLALPDIYLLICDALAVYDNLRGEITLLFSVDINRRDALEFANEQLDRLIADLQRPFAPAALDFRHFNASDLTAKVHYEMGETGYKNAVATIKDYIVAGDVMQVVPSQRMSFDFKHSPRDFYRALRYANPSPYMYLMNFADHHVVGSSPEILLRKQGNKLTVRPIAGTRPRGKDQRADQLLAQQLLGDAKELAEHAMLIDLGRNDIGKICRSGTVKISEKMAIERYSHVMHIVSNVDGILRDGMSALDALRATFPAGTLSGAPKIRAMEIINELEPSRRGIYGGAIGYWSWSDNMDLAIAIRTALIKNEKLYAQAGAGIVYDSVSDLEWLETINKLNALLHAAAMLPEDND